MSTENNTNAQNYQNVMEILVNDEIDRQLKHLSENLLKYINRIEVATYALNRLPPLYASCQEGFAKQKQQAKKYRGKIHETVRQAIAAVQRDPIRLSTPLISPEEVQYEQTLRELLELLPKQRDDRKNALECVREAIVAPPKTRRGPIAPPPTLQQRTRVPSKPLLSHQEQIREQLRLTTLETFASQEAESLPKYDRKPSRQSLFSDRDPNRERRRAATSVTPGQSRSENVETDNPDWTNPRYSL